MPTEKQQPHLAPDTVAQEEAAPPIIEGRPRRRKSPEERLQRALAQHQALQTKISGLKSELDEKNRKARNRGLTLIGVVVEQCWTEGVFDISPEISRVWWLEQATRLQEKDQDAYRRFLRSIKSAAEKSE